MKQTIVSFIFLICGLSAYAQSVANSCQQYSSQYRQQCYENATRLRLSGAEVKDCRDLFSSEDAIRCLEYRANGHSRQALVWCVNNMMSSSEFECADLIGLRNVSQEILGFCVDSFTEDTNELACIRTLMNNPQISLQVAQNCANNTLGNQAALRCIQDYGYSVTVDAEVYAPIEAVAQ